jgi:hypothetical protein
MRIIMSGLSMRQATWGMKQGTTGMMYLGQHRFHRRDVQRQVLEFHQIGLASTLALQAAFYKIHQERSAGELVKILAVLSTHRNHVQKMAHTCSMYKCYTFFSNSRASELDISINELQVLPAYHIKAPRLPQ